MARLVVVDPDAARRREIEEELGRLGHDIVPAPSAAFALTMMDRARIDLVVSAAHTGDMDACELCGILRSDPQHAGLLFVLLGVPGGPSPWAAARAGIDEALPPSFTMPALVSRVDTLLRRAARGRLPAGRPAGESRPRPARPAPAGRVLEGSLGVMDVPEIAQAIALGGKSGRLEVSLAAGDGLVVFEMGRVAHAEFGGARGEPAFAALVSAAYRERAGSFRFLPEAGAAGGPRTIGKGVDELLLAIASDIDEGREQPRSESPVAGSRPAGGGA
jgi:CheY-like chemotaxis protein